MTAGHFGLAAVVKSEETKVPLWALMVATYLLDFVFIILVAAGVESFAPMNPGHPAYGQVIIHADYSHSLVGALILAVVAGALAWWAWTKRDGIVIGAVVFSHWLLDLIVHRAGLPILPGNLGHLPLLGFGLWQVPVASAVVELGLAIGGAVLYYRSARGAPGSLTQADPRRLRALLASGVTGLLIVLLLTSDVMGLSLLISITLMLLLIVLCGWLDSRLQWKAQPA